MASESLIGRYKLYKAGTRKLVDWLTTAAGKCCDLRSVIRSLRAEASVKRSTKKPNRASPPASQLCTSELLKLAGAIVNAQPPVEVPAAILEILRDVIAGRRECAGWYASQSLESGGDVEKENLSHQYFILVSTQGCPR